MNDLPETHVSVKPKNRNTVRPVFCVLCAVMLGFCSVVLAGDSGSVPDPESEKMANDFYTLGEQYFSQKNYEDALKAYSKSLKYNPGFPEALYKKGEALEFLSNELTALKYYKRCLECLEAKDELGEPLQKLKEKCSVKVDKINKTVNTLDDYDRDFIDSLIGLAGKTMDIDDNILTAEILDGLILKINPAHEKSLEFLKKINSAAPSEFNQDMTYLNYNMGVEEFKKGDYKKAADKFEEALLHAKETFDIHMKLAETYDKLKDQPKTAKHCRCCLKYLRGKQTMSAEENKSFEKIAALLKKSDSFGKELSKFKSSYAQKTLGFGKSCGSAKHLQSALKSLNRASLAEPDNKVIHELLKKYGENMVVIVDVSETDTQKSTRLLFNGKDVADWVRHWGAFPEIWAVKDGMLVVDVPANGEPAILIHKNSALKDYTLVCEFKANEIKVPDNSKPPAMIQFILACNLDPTQPGTAITVDSIDLVIEKLNENNVFKVTISKKGKTIEGAIDYVFGGKAQVLKIPPRELKYDKEYIGIQIRNMKVTVSSMVLNTQ